VFMRLRVPLKREPWLTNNAHSGPFHTPDGSSSFVGVLRPSETLMRLLQGGGATTYQGIIEPIFASMLRFRQKLKNE